MKIYAKKITLFSLTFLMLLCYFSAWWAVRTYGSISMEEIVFHLNVPLEGVNTEYIISYLGTALLPALLVFLITVAVYGRCLLFLRRRKTCTCLDIRLGERQWYIELSEKAFSRSMALLLAFSLILMVVGTDNMLNIGQYLYSQFHKSTFIEEQYVKPDASLLTFPEKKRNLIYIYLESVEKTFEDREHGGDMEENAIPELTRMAEEHVTFDLGSDGKQGILPLTSSWTIAAMVAQTSGLPLKIPVEKNSMSKYESFLPGAVTLGELLEDAGYQNMLMVGSYASFAGRDQFFKDHGNYKIWDFGTAKRLKKVPKDYDIGWWGIEDEKLFEYAKEELTKLSEKDKPFNFTMLTVDTHNPNGYVCRLCGNESDNQYTNVLRCSSRQTAAFVDWIKEQPWYENTTIVIAGDHATMVKNYAPEDTNYNRGVYYCFINPAATPDERNHTACTMDLFPTTLAAMGVEIKGERLGLGTNLFSGEDTILDAFGEEEVVSQINMKSVFYDDVLLYGGTEDSKKK